jgi:signal transduction histidine kinase
MLAGHGNLVTAHPALDILPRLSSEQSRQMAKMEPAIASSPKILSVDDTPANLLAIRALLEPLGYEIRDARSGEEALSLVARHEFAVVLLDVMMPGMDGLETLARLRRTPAVADVPVILITASNLDLGTISRAYTLGAVDYIAKPVPPEILRGKVRAFVSFYEVNKELRARDAALASKDRHMAVLAHDLRNPLNAIVAGVNLLLKADLPPSAMHVGERVNRAAARMSTMIRDLLDHSRVLAGALSISRAPVDLGSLCGELVADFELADPERRIQMSIAGEVRGEWDAARIYQALSNLVGNATRYGHGRAEVFLDGRGPGVEIAIRNDGPPIPPDLMPLLFEPFERGVNDGTGLGLGLFIVRVIAEAHGGEVSAQSSAERGTVFVLRLPRAATRQDQALAYA